MLVKNKETGQVETLRHGPATDAVTAGTHEFVNLDEQGEPKEGGVLPETAGNEETTPALGKGGRRAL